MYQYKIATFVYIISKQISMKDFSIYKFYKGEEKNPFNKEDQPTHSMFWFYEYMFELDFMTRSSSDWYSFFDDYGFGKKFMGILTEKDYEKPTIERKRAIFDLWLEYLFAHKLYGEYGEESQYKKEYYSIAQ